MINLSLIVLSQNFFSLYFSRLKESWYDQQISFILYEVNTAQDKLESYIKKEAINSNQTSLYSNTKLEPIEGRGNMDRFSCSYYKI